MLDYLTARENVGLAASYVREKRAASRAKVETLLQSMGLQARSKHFPRELSGGEQQRVAVARALINGAGLVLCDEPTGALDAAHSGEVLDVLEDLVESGHTVVVASHDAGVVERASRRIELRDGAVIADSGHTATKRTGHIFSQPHSAATPWRTAFGSALVALKESRLRSAFVLLSIALGAWSVISLFGLMEAANREAMSVMERVGSNRLSVSGGQVEATDYGSRFRHFPMTFDDARAVEREIDNVRSVHPSMSRGMRVRSPLAELEMIPIHATDGIQAKTPYQNLPWPIDRGVFLTPEDREALAQVAVIGPALSEHLFGAEANPVGGHIEINGMQFLVKGLLGPRPKLYGEGEVFITDPKLLRPGLSFVPMARGLDVFVPLETGVEFLFGGEEQIALDLQVEDVSRLEETAADIRDLMFRRHGHRYEVTSEAQTLAAREALSGALTAAFVLMGLAALIVGGFGILSVMLESVDARTREIGIRRAVGARRGDISAQFLVESAMLAVCGGVIGALLSLAGAPLLSMLNATDVVFEWWYFVLAMGSAATIGLLFGIVPAVKAATLEPAKALRLP